MEREAHTRLRLAVETPVDGSERYGQGLHTKVIHIQKSLTPLLCSDIHPGAYETKTKEAPTFCRRVMIVLSLKKR